MVIHTAILWGWRDPFLTEKARLRIAKAACRLIAYDMGYPGPLAYTRLPYWYGEINEAILKGEDRDPISPSHCGRESYVSEIERTYPGYLHELYRYAESVKGNLATFQELAETMNLKSSAPGEHRVPLSLSRRQLSAWSGQIEERQIVPRCNNN